MKSKLLCALFAMVFLAGTAVARNWDRAGTFTVTGADTAEVRLGALSVSDVRITCTRGHVTIKGIVVSERDRESTVNVNERMSDGDTKEVSLSSFLGIVGLKIIHEGSGSYQVETR